MRYKRSQCEPITEEEEKWIRRFKRVCKDCPGSLWLYSNGTLHIMKTPPDGEQMGAGGGDGTGVNPDNCVDMVNGIHSDGGDW